MPMYMPLQNNLWKPFNAQISIRVTHQASSRGVIKGVALRLHRKNFPKATFEENIQNFESRLNDRGYPASVVKKHLSEVKFSDRKSGLKQKHNLS